MITLFGFIWLFLLGYNICKKNVEKVFFLTLFSMIFQCNDVFIIFSTGIGPQVITSFTFIVFSFFISEYSLKINKKVIFFTFPWFLLLLIIIITNIINLTLTKNLFRVLQIYIYIVCFIRLFNLSRIYRIDLDKMIRIIFWFVVIIGIFQYLMSTGILPKFWIAKSLLFNEQNNPVVFFYNTNVKRVFSTFMEASYCAPVLVGGFYYVMYERFNNNFKKYDNLLLIILLIEIYLTLSATAYIIFIAVGIFTCLLLPNNKKSFIFKTLFIMVCLLGIIFLYEEVISKVESKLLSGSGVARNGWNIVALRKFNANKLIGVGYKNSRASSLIFTILSEMGLIGFGVYFFAIFTLFKSILNIKLLKSYVRKYLILLISALLAQIISCPDLDFCVFWLFNYLVGIAYGLSLSKNYKLNYLYTKEGVINAEKIKKRI